jgi:hypothetical protein
MYTIPITESNATIDSSPLLSEAQAVHVITFPIYAAFLKPISLSCERVIVQREVKDGQKGVPTVASRPLSKLPPSGCLCDAPRGGEESDRDGQRSQKSQRLDTVLRPGL